MSGSSSSHRKPGTAVYVDGHAPGQSPLFGSAEYSSSARAGRSNSLHVGSQTASDRTGRCGSGSDVPAQRARDANTSDVKSRRIEQETDRVAGGDKQSLELHQGLHSCPGALTTPGDLLDSYDRQRRAASERSSEDQSELDARRRRNAPVRPSALATSVDAYSSSSHQYPDGDGQKRPEQQQFKYCRYTAVAEVDNERYQSDGFGYPEHDREDRHCALVYKEFDIYAVFDGHDGSRASQFVNDIFQHVLVQRFERDEIYTKEQIQDALKSVFSEVEQEYFVSLEPFMFEKVRLQSMIPEVLYFM